MTRAPRIAAALFGFACAFVVVVARPAAAATMDPFRPTSESAAASRSKSARSPLLPFRTAQAPSLPDQPAEAAPAPTPAPVASPPKAPAAKACQKDDDCPEGNICAANVCRASTIVTR